MRVSDYSLIKYNEARTYLRDYHKILKVAFRQIVDNQTSSYSKDTMDNLELWLAHPGIIFVNVPSKIILFISTQFGGGLFIQ